MVKITEVTRRDLFEIIQNGFTKDKTDAIGLFSSEPNVVYMPFCGCLTTIEFLERLYDLGTLPSTDYRYKNAKGDIICHTVSFNDWPEFWFLDDDRFELKDGFDDGPILRFLCEMLHPAVRDESSPWQDYLNRFNELLKPDGYEIYSSYKVSGRDIFRFREYTPIKEEFSEESLFTNRYRSILPIEDDKLADLLCKDISSNIKRSLIDVLIRFSEPRIVQPNRYDPYEINTDAMYISLGRLNDYLADSVVPLNSHGYYGHEYAEYLEHVSVPIILDLIEIQYDELSDQEKPEYCAEINKILLRSKANLFLSEHGVIEQKIVYEVLNHEVVQNIDAITEPGLQELLSQAITLHQFPSTSAHRDAVEKIWDAFERLKTYYAELDKKSSAGKIVGDLSMGKSEFATIFEEEFKALTTIGNNFRIRHHETNKVDISDIRHYDYFFNRCLSLISTAIQYLE